MGDGNSFPSSFALDGYDHVVPTINGLAVEYFRWLAQLAKARNDPDAAKYAQRADTLDKSFQNLWNEKAGWFDNLYEDSSRHLFTRCTCLTARHLSRNPARKRSHGCALSPKAIFSELGIYSSRRRIPSTGIVLNGDWGGGGAYIWHTAAPAPVPL